ncbi:MAG: hypothetical protein ACLQT7_04000 [Candidatus Dormibacteria bacterium]
MLWPLARRFGASDDRARQANLRGAPSDELQELVSKVDQQVLRQIDEYLNATADAPEAVPYGDLAQAAIEAGMELKRREQS